MPMQDCAVKRMSRYLGMENCTNLCRNKDIVWMYLAVFFTNKECETCWFFGVMYWTGDQEVHQF